MKMSTFQGLEIAKTGLFVSQKALDVTGHNIANANTPGYTRQVVDMVSIAPPLLLACMTSGERR